MGFAVKGVTDKEMQEQASEAAEAEKNLAKMDAELEQMEADAKEYAENGLADMDEETTETTEE